MLLLAEEDNLTCLSDMLVSAGDSWLEEGIGEVESPLTAVRRLVLLSMEACCPERLEESGLLVDAEIDVSIPEIVELRDAPLSSRLV